MVPMHEQIYTVRYVCSDSKTGGKSEVCERPLTRRLLFNGALRICIWLEAVRGKAAMMR
jgi:hypothetical protein